MSLKCYNPAMEVNGLDEMNSEAERLIAALAPREDGAAVIALSGDLGAGKTTFAQGIARALGVEGHVTSPTFVLEKIYDLQDQKWRHLIHIDAYRITDAHELEVLGWDEITADPTNLIVVEWPEHVATLVPKHTTHVFFKGMGESREVVYGQ